SPAASRKWRSWLPNAGPSSGWLTPRVTIALHERRLRGFSVAELSVKCVARQEWSPQAGGMPIPHRLSVLAAASIASFALLTSACTPAPPTVPTAPATQSGTDTPATGEPIKIGFVWGVTGAAAEIVRPSSDATHAYFDDLNKHGGIHGRPVQMVEI